MTGQEKIESTLMVLGTLRLGEMLAQQQVPVDAVCLRLLMLLKAGLEFVPDTPAELFASWGAVTAAHLLDIDTRGFELEIKLVERGNANNERNTNVQE